MGKILLFIVEFWKRVLAKINIQLNDFLQNIFMRKDKSLKYNAKRTSEPQNKLKRSAKLRDNIIEQMKQESDAVKEGKTYNSGSAIETKSAKAIVLEILKLNRQEQKDVDKRDKTCKYYPIFCSKVGHNSAQDKQCNMNGKSKEDKKISSDSMEDLMIEKYLSDEPESKFILSRCNLLICICNAYNNYTYYH